MTVGPNIDLMRRFETSDFYQENLEKKAALPLLLKALGVAGTAALVGADSKHRERQLQEAAVLNQLFRELEAEKQRGTQDALSGKGSALSPQGQAAQQLNSMQSYHGMLSLMDKGGSALSGLAIEALEGMDKEAIGALLGGVAKGMGKMLGGAGAKAPGVVGKLKGAPRAVGPKAAGLPGTQGVAQAAQASRGPGVLAGAKKAVTPGWKSKALVGGAALGAAYTGYKGLQTARDYMMQPTYASNNWGGTGTLRGPVNQYGYTGR